MSDTPTPMPEAPWWSTPGTTAVLPDEAPPSAPPPPPARPRSHRPVTAGLLALALVLGGATGGGVAMLLDDDPTVVTGTTALDRRSLGSVVKGTTEAAAAAIAPSVVTVEVTGQVGSPFGGLQSQSGTGSGVVIRSEGYVLTNNHVIAAAVDGGSVHVTLADGRTVAASIVGTDPSADLAVLKLEGVTGLTAATFAESDDLRVGQAVLAVGAPLGLANTVTQGIVSTLHRPVRTGQTTNDQAVIDAVQTDAAINPGNSGGALVDLAGRVVGINSAIATAGGTTGNIGVGFAIPSETATKIADQIIRTGSATHSQIGVSVADAPSGTDGAPGLGALIRAVQSGGPAANAGLQVGDVVTKVDDRRVTDADSLIVAVRSHDPGETVTLTLTRDGKQHSLRATLGRSSS
ncbi:MAG TPA: trypsin-like peptidase domain-containing protein [Mycobacteriales bacterium]|nr:trypsin-like peptidase domain-containing protein [Mycobacteriales bacterium]